MNSQVRIIWQLDHLNGMERGSQKINKTTFAFCKTSLQKSTILPGQDFAERAQDFFLKNTFLDETGWIFL